MTCVAAARTPEIRSTAVPEADSVKFRPLNVRLFGAGRVPGVVTVCGPVPLSMVNTTPVTVDELSASRLVMFAFNRTERLPETAAPEAPPVQLRTISPTRSVRPSPRRMAGVDVALQTNAD